MQKHPTRGRFLVLAAILTIVGPSSFSSTPVLAQSPENPPSQAPTPDAPGTIEGRVVLEEGAGSVHLTVTLVELRRRGGVGTDGSFRFTAVPPGEYLILAESEVGGSGVAQVRVGSGETVQVEIPLELTTIRDEVLVTATASPRSQLEIAQPTSVLADEDLVLRSDTTLGGTLDEEPGVTSTYFGPGASRPVIRGMGGDRIRVLESGIGAADASSASPDHAVSSDPLTAERIEVIRGPATLLYGSSAVGGVVNVLSGRIPSYVPEEPVTGELHVVAGSAADERSGAAVLEGALPGLGGDNVAWHADYSHRETDDYEIPGFAEVEPDEGEEPGLLENSAQENESGAFGLSWVGERGFLGASVSGFETLYGVPGHGHGHGEEEHEEDEHGEEEEEAVRIDLRQRRVDLQGELLTASGPFQGFKLRVGMADYEHMELEGTEVGTRFENDSYEGRVDLVQREVGRLSGTIGLQASTSDFLAIGEEAFVPPSTTDLLAVFAYEEIDFEPFRLQVGARWETQEIDPEGPAGGVGEGGEPFSDRSFDAFSGSAGGIWSFTASDSLAATLSRSERIPTANELFANGPHAATRAFEIGDPDLGVETATGLDLSWRRISQGGGPVTGTLSIFFARFDDYVFEAFTGEEEDELDVIRFRQADADFYGAEAEAAVDLWRRGESHLVLELSGDSVRAELRDTDEPLPRIPPLRLGAGLDFHSGPWRVFGEVRWADMQDRVSSNETETDGYTLVNAAVSHRFLVAGTVLDVILRGKNLTDEEARPHTSFLKDQVPLPGRDVSLALGLHF